MAQKSANYTTSVQFIIFCFGKLVWNVKLKHRRTWNNDTNMKAISIAKIRAAAPSSSLSNSNV